MLQKSANERTFQGELMRMINKIIADDTNIVFSKITQEQNVGKKGSAKFADGILYSAIDTNKKVFFELKNTKWDATDDELVNKAMFDAFNNGVPYFVTGTPRQLVIYETFKPNTTIRERKLKIYNISNVRSDDDVLLPIYEKEVYPKLKVFLAELSQIIHATSQKQIQWDSIDRYFVNKLSAYILEASADMFVPMQVKIDSSSAFKQKLRKYLKTQEIFNVTLQFEAKDIYNLCQLCNYLLYLKIIFYTYLQRDVPQLGLKPLEIPEDKDLLNKVLRERFNDVLKHDFETIFSPTVLDEFEFTNAYIPELKRNVLAIKNLNFDDLNADIIGAIYNTLIDNQEQHDRGQHFTNTNEVDIVNAFCIRKGTHYLIDTGCGAGTFLVRGYHFLKYHQPKFTHEQLLEKVWGIEIAPFPAFLATMNLCLQNIKAYDNYPIIIQSDFADIKKNYSYYGFFLNKNKTVEDIFEVKKIDGKKAEVKMPYFDACVGNPPYIRQELIGNKEQWNDLAENEQGLKKINQQSDLYVYYLMHTAAFLREGGRMGYVIASSWLDVAFGTGLQKFLLDHFKIIAIIDHQTVRSFETASINTVILIVERNEKKDVRENNTVRFLRIYTDYETLIGKYSDTNRIEKVIQWVQSIENTKKSIETPHYDLFAIQQGELQSLSTFYGKYENGNWGAKFLRSPKIYQKMMAKAQGKMVLLSQLAEVKYGIKTGANEFFYVIDETHKVVEMPEDKYMLTFGTAKQKHLITWKTYSWCLSEMTGEHFLIEKEYLSPLFKTQGEAENLDVKVNKLKYRVLMCSEGKNALAKKRKKVLEYIEIAESKAYEIHKRPSCSSRTLWYDLSSAAVIGDFIFPSKIGEKYRLIDNRKANVFCDKVNYAITAKAGVDKDVLFLVLNSISFRFLIDLFARQLTGAQTLSDVDVNVVANTYIPKTEQFGGGGITKVELLLRSLKLREQGTIFEEIKQADKREIDTLIFKHLGLAEKEVSELYAAAAKYVSDRSQKSASVVTSKVKKALTYEESLALVRERFPEVNPYKALIKGMTVQKFLVPVWKGKYPKTDHITQNLFDVYDVDFVQGNQKIKLTFAHPQQLELMKFLNQTLEIADTSIALPKIVADCEKVLQALNTDFLTYFPQMKNLLKNHRSKVNPLALYRELLVK